MSEPLTVLTCESGASQTFTQTQKRLCDFLPQLSGGKKQSKHELNSLFNDSLCSNNRAASICGNLI